MAIVLALCSALVYGTSDYLGGRATRRAPVFAVTFFTQLTTATLAVLIVVIDRAPFPGRADVAWSLGAGWMSLLGILAFYEALARGAMTVVAPITAVVSAVVPVAVGVASGERPAPVAIVGVVLAIIAVALVSGVGGHAERPTPPRIAGLAVIAGVGFGLLFVFLDRTSDDSGFWPLCLGQLASLPVIVGLVVVRRVRVAQIGRSAVLAVAAGALAVTANVSYLLATREGLLSLVAVITSMYPATTVGLATVLDGERMRPPQVVGLVLAVVAVGMVALG